MKLLIVSLIVALLVTTGFIYLVRKVIGKSGYMALAAAVVLAILIAPVTAAHAIGIVLLIAMLFIAVTE